MVWISYRRSPRQRKVLYPSSDHFLKQTVPLENKSDKRLVVGLTYEGFCGFIVGYHVSGFMDCNKGDISSSYTITTDGSDCTRDFPCRSDHPSPGGGLSVFPIKNTREPLNPSRLTQGIASRIYKSVNQWMETPGMSLLLPVSPA
jgi:hypothetical protein